MTLTYESRKVVLMYLDANLRFQLSVRAPSLRTIEKIMQLQIDRLVLSERIITINDTPYKIGLCRNYHGETPEYADYKNRTGGYENDQDEYGVDRIGRENDAIDGHVTVNLHQHFDRDQRREVRPIHRIIQDFHNKIIEYERYAKNAFQDIYDIEYEMMIRRGMADYENKRDNRSPNYMHYVQLTIGERPFDRMTYSKRLYEYQAGLLNFMFKKRREKVLVKHFEVEYPRVYHFPNNVKFKIRTMKLNENLEPSWVLKQLEPVSDETPLSLLDAELRENFQTEFDHPGVRSAEKLVIRNRELIRFALLHSISNKSIHIGQAPNFTDVEYMQIVREWMRDGGQVGTAYHFGIKWLNVVTRFFFKLQDSYPAAVVADGDKQVTIPMNGAKAFVTYYTYDRDDRSWILSLEITSIH